MCDSTRIVRSEQERIARIGNTGDEMQIAAPFGVFASLNAISHIAYADMIGAAVGDTVGVIVAVHVERDAIAI